MKLKDFSKLFFALLVLHIVAIYKPSVSNTLFYFSKPLLLFSLLSFFIHRTANLFLPFKFVFFGALVFSFVGDILLMFADNEFYFLGGVGSFLLAQVAFAVFFIGNSKTVRWKNILLTLPVVAGAFYFLNSYLSVPADMVLPLNVYGASLALMVLSAINYAGGVGRRSIFILLGAFAFLLSDLLLAYGKFEGQESKEISILVMITYGIAQFLLATSVLAIAEKQNDSLYKGSAS